MQPNANFLLLQIFAHPSTTLGLTDLDNPNVDILHFAPIVIHLSIWCDQMNQRWAVKGLRTWRIERKSSNFHALFGAVKIFALNLKNFHDFNVNIFNICY
jgi:hypothetical protein